MEKIILDCDPGHDDAMALMMAVASSEIELLAVTTSAGNQTPEKTLNNALKMLTLLGATDVPVAGGNQSPLMKELEIAADVHGDSGLDGAPLPEPSFAPVKMHAIELMAQVLRAQAEPITLVVTGPMTNMALFLKVYPELMPKIKQIVFMGGAKGFGNRTPVAEFNIAVDPEAAKIVMNAGIPLVMAGLNVTHQAQIWPNELEEIATITDNVVAQTLAGQMKFYSIYYSDEKWGFKGVPMHDPCALAWLIDPSLFTCAKYNVDVETKGELTSGQTVVDEWDLTGKPKNTEVLLDVKRQDFVALIFKLLHHFDGETTF